MTFDFRYPTPLPSTKGWGPGWPDCQTDKRIQHPVFQGGIREEIFELVGLLVVHLEDRGYRFHDGWSWGWGCRATDKDADPGDPDATPSFHSWGLALDFNAPENPFSKSAADTAKLNNEDKWVVGVMAEYGFFWLGPPIGDWMHFSFCGSPADARAMTEKARRELDMTDEEREMLRDAFAIYKGIEDFIEDRTPPADSRVTRRRTFKALKRAAESPAAVPGPAGPPGPQGPKGDAATLPSGSRLRVE